MQLLMFETSGKLESKLKVAAAAVCVRKDVPAENARHAASAAPIATDIDRPRRVPRVEEEADRWDGLY